MKSPAFAHASHRIAQQDARLDHRLFGLRSRACAVISALVIAVVPSSVLATPVATPSNLTASVSSSGAVTLRWTDNSVIETGYLIERTQTAPTSDGGRFFYMGQTRANGTSFTQTNLPWGTSHIYRVRAYRQVNSSTREYSNYKEVRVTIGNTQPPPAPAPTISNFSASPSSITSGQSSTLSATFASGTGRVNPGNLAINSGSSVTVRPTSSTTYTLTVTNTSGQTATRNATVSVSAAPPPPTTPPPSTPPPSGGQTFTENFPWKGNHAASVHDNHATTVWWNPDSWDARLDDDYNSAYTATGMQTPGRGPHVDIHKAASSDPRIGEEDNEEFAVGGRSGVPGVAVMRIEFQGINSSRLRNPMVITNTRPGVVSFYASKFITNAHWWEIAITPVNKGVIGGEFTAVPSDGVQGNTDGWVTALNAGNCFRAGDGLQSNSCSGQGIGNGPGRRRGGDSINISTANINDVAPVSDLRMHFQGLKFVTGVNQYFADHFATPRSSRSQMIKIHPSEMDTLTHWKMEFWPNKVDIWGDLAGDGQYTKVDTLNVTIPGSWGSNGQYEVYVHLLVAAYQADHHPAGNHSTPWNASSNPNNTWYGTVRDFHWRNVQVSPVKYSTTSVAPQDGVTEINSRRLGWMAYDFRDFQRHGVNKDGSPKTVNGAPQPNLVGYRWHAQMAFTSVFEYGSLSEVARDLGLDAGVRLGAPPASAGGTLQVNLSSAQAAARKVMMVYDIRNYNPSSPNSPGNGTADVYVNGTWAGTLRMPSWLSRNVNWSNDHWIHTSTDLPMSVFRAGNNTVELRFAGAIQLDRLTLEFGH